MYGIMKHLTEFWGMVPRSHGYISSFSNILFTYFCLFLGTHQHFCVCVCVKSVEWLQAALSAAWSCMFGCCYAIFLMEAKQGHEVWSVKFTRSSPIVSQKHLLLHLIGWFSEAWTSTACEDLQFSFSVWKNETNSPPCFIFTSLYICLILSASLSSGFCAWGFPLWNIM